MAIDPGRQRQPLAVKAAPRHAPALGAARRAAAHRHQVRLRGRPVRRLHACRSTAQPIRACVTPVSAWPAAKITTIESLGGAHPVQAAWVKHDVPQCGYCQSGQIMSRRRPARRRSPRPHATRTSTGPWTATSAAADLPAHPRRHQGRRRADARHRPRHAGQGLGRRRHERSRKPSRRLKGSTRREAGGRRRSWSAAPGRGLLARRPAQRRRQHRLRRLRPLHQDRAGRRGDRRLQAHRDSARATMRASPPSWPRNSTPTGPR